jgi:tetratricopeptide (TPR) repeat protein
MMCAALTLVLMGGAGALAQTPAAPEARQTPAPPEARQTPAVAAAHRAIATSVPAAQTAFDRGLVMLYAFNVGEARTAFRAAEAADPRATLAYFGEAVAETIDINLPTTPAGERRGADALARGRSAAAAGTVDDRALFAAATLRFDGKGSSKDRFVAYFRAMQAYTDAHPADGMAATLAAYAGWNGTDLLTQSPSDELTADAQLMAADLDRALAIDPQDVGAHHLRIHFWEEAHHPERALADADYLASLSYDPGESHLEHMAGHIFDRLGDYDRMVAVNRGACANDDLYFSQGNGDGQTYMRTYHEHDVDFVLYGLTTIGRNADAAAFAARDSDYSRELVALRTHDSRQVLALLGDAVTPMRVIAEARSGDVERARKDLAGLHSRGSTDVEFLIATAAVARAADDDGAAIAAYQEARSAAGSDLGDPKEHWWTPVAEGLGATLLEARRPADAEAVFRAELARYPNDPRLEFGLAEALKIQGKDDRVARLAYLAGWQGVKPLALGDLG